MSSLTVNAADRQRLLETYPEVFHRSFMQRWGLALVAGLVIVYLALSFNFFKVIPTFVNGNWDRASIYIQDWYSWRAQPRLRFVDGKVTPQWNSRASIRRMRSSTGCCRQPQAAISSPTAAMPTAWR